MVQFSCTNCVHSKSFKKSQSDPNKVINFLKTNIGYASIGISSAILMTDYINTFMYYLHIHPTPKGPTGFPTPTMI